MKRFVPFSSIYDSSILEALAIQIFVGIFALLVIDYGQVAQICGIALVAFWPGVAVLIWRNPKSPRWVDLKLISFGYLLVVPIAFFLVVFIWHLRFSH